MVTVAGSQLETRLDDTLGAARLGAAIKDLSRPELRKVRTYEQKHDNRKSVLGAIEKQLG